jgi:hypothetical protein
VDQEEGSVALIIGAPSGWTDHGWGDWKDMHKYPGPGMVPPMDDRVSVLGEFGGLGLPVEGHLWKIGRHWGYQNMASRDQLTARYVELLRGVHRLKETVGLSAGVYTQTTDVEGEVNGLLTYDRKLIKPDVAKTAAANRGQFPPKPTIKTVVPTSEAAGVEWKYTTDKPGEDWQKPEFDDSAWKTGPGGFGTEGTPGAIVRTKWDSADIWLRRTVDIPAATFRDLQLRIHHDEDAEVFVNGVRAGTLKGHICEYAQVYISADALKALKAGKNVIAVHCRQTGGGQYIDVGLVDHVPAKAE